MADKPLDALKFAFSRDSLQKVILLVGNSGSGRLTTIRTMAAERNFEVVTELQVEKEVLEREYAIKNSRERKQWERGISHNEENMHDPVPEKRRITDNVLIKEILERITRTGLISRQKTVYVIRILPEVFTTYSQDSLRDWLSEYFSDNNRRSMVIFILNSSSPNTIYFRNKFERLARTPTWDLKVIECSTNTTKIKTALDKIVAESRQISFLIDKKEIEAIAAENSTSIHQAIIELQMLAATRWVKKKQTMNPEKSNKYSLKWLANDNFFHKIGKVLYNKRIKISDTQDKKVGKVKKKEATIKPENLEGKEFDKNKSNHYFKISDLIASLSIGRTLANFRSFIFDNYLNFAGNMDDVSRISRGFADLEVHISNTWKVEALRNTAKEENILTEQYCLNFMNKSRFRNKNKTGLYTFTNHTERPKQIKMKSREVDEQLFSAMMASLPQISQRPKTPENVIIDDDIESLSDERNDDYGFGSLKDSLKMNPENSLNFIQQLTNKSPQFNPANSHDEYKMNYNIEAEIDLIDLNHYSQQARPGMHIPEDLVTQEIGDCLDDRINVWQPRGNILSSQIYEELDDLEYLTQKSKRPSTRFPSRKIYEELDDCYPTAHVNKVQTLDELEEAFLSQIIK